MSIPLFTESGLLLLCGNGKLSASCCNCEQVWLATVHELSSNPDAWCRHSVAPSTVHVCTRAGVTSANAALAARKALDIIHNYNSDCCDPNDPTDCNDFCAGHDQWVFTLVASPLQSDLQANGYGDVVFSFEDCPAVGTGTSDGEITLRMTPV